MKDLTKILESARFEVLKYLQEGLSISEIAKARKVSRQAIYDILSKMIKEGLIRYPKRSLYEVTEKGIGALHSFVALRYNYRQHNLSIKVKVLESPKNWDKKRNEIRFLPYFNKTIKLKNNEQDLFNYGKLQIKTTSKSVIIKLPTIYAPDWENALVQAMQIFEDSIYKIEKMFKIVLIKQYKGNITFISQEYARIQDALAKRFRIEENRLYLTGEDGKIWLITDFSFSVDELEYVHPNKATDDIDAIAPFLNDLRKNPATISEIREVVKELASVQVSNAQNINKHQKVLDEMLITLRKIQESLDKR